MLGVDRRKPRHVHHGEEHVAELFLYPRAIAGGEGGGGLATFLFDLAPGGARIRPVEVHAGGLRRDALGAYQRRQRARHPVDDRARTAGLARLALLDRLPLGQGLLRRLDAHSTEDVRMPADHLVDESAEDVTDCELLALGSDPGMEDHLKEKIAELLLERGGALGLDRFEHLVGFFEQEGLERLAGLFAVPRAPPRPAKTVHDLEEPFKENTGGLGHDRCLRVK